MCRASSDPWALADAGRDGPGPRHGPVPSSARPGGPGPGQGPARTSARPRGAARVHWQVSTSESGRRAAAAGPPDFGKPGSARRIVAVMGEDRLSSPAGVRLSADASMSRFKFKLLRPSLLLAVCQCQWPPAAHRPWHWQAPSHGLSRSRRVVTVTVTVVGHGFRVTPAVAGLRVRAVWPGPPAGP